MNACLEKRERTCFSLPMNSGSSFAHTLPRESAFTRHLGIPEYQNIAHNLVILVGVPVINHSRKVLMAALITPVFLLGGKNNKTFSGFFDHDDIMMPQSPKMMMGKQGDRLIFFQASS